MVLYYSKNTHTLNRKSPTYIGFFCLEICARDGLNKKPTSNTTIMFAKPHISRDQVEIKLDLFTTKELHKHPKLFNNQSGVATSSSHLHRHEV